MKRSGFILIILTDGNLPLTPVNETGSIWLYTGGPESARWTHDDDKVVNRQYQTHLDQIDLSCWSLECFDVCQLDENYSSTGVASMKSRRHETNPWSPTIVDHVLKIDKGQSSFKQATYVLLSFSSLFLHLRAIFASINANLRENNFSPRRVKCGNKIGL